MVFPKSLTSIFPGWSKLNELSEEAAIRQQEAEVAFLSNDGHDDMQPEPPKAVAKKSSGTEAPTKPKRRRMSIPPLPGTQWGQLLERCYALMQDDSTRSIRAFCKLYCPEHERRFYDAWKESGLQGFSELRLPLQDPRVQKALDEIVAIKTMSYIKNKKRKHQALSARELPTKKKARIPHRTGPRGPYNRLLSGEEWAVYLLKCYEFHLVSDKASILAFANEYCPSRRRTFYTVWKKSNLQECLKARAPVHDPRVIARLQQFIQEHNESLYARRHRKEKKPSECPPATARTPALQQQEREEQYAARLRIEILESTPIGVAILLQTQSGQHLSAIRVGDRDFIMFQNGRLVKMDKIEILREYGIVQDQSSKLNVHTFSRPATSEVSTSEDDSSVENYENMHHKARAYVGARNSALRLR